MGDKEYVMEPSENQHSLNEYGVAGGKKKELCQPSLENKKPPELSFKLKKAGDVPKSTKTWSDDCLPIDILLLTSVESCDFLSCFSFLDQPFKCYKKEIGVVYFGHMGDVSDQEKLKVALMNCSKGAAAPGGSLTVVMNAVRVLQPKAVFLVGTCISLGLEKARMGDVVISSRLTTTEGFKTPGSPLLGNLVRDAPYGWIAPLKNPDEWEIKVHCNGDILSQSLREKCQNVNIYEQYPTAVAIETEGEGVYAAAYDANIEWVIVKGAASYFHQSQSATSEWMSFASTMAASVVAKILSDPAVFREWPHYNQGVEHALLDRGYSSLRSGDLESAISAPATVQHTGVDHSTLDQGASLMTSNRLASTMASQSRIKENRGKRPLHPIVTTTPERKRQNTDIPERVDHGTSDQGASLLTSNRLSSTIGSHTRIRENHGRKRPLHPLKTTAQERQRQIKNIAPRVDHGTSDQGASLLTSNRLASAMGSQFRRKENHGKRPWHLLKTATPKRQRQNTDFPETDIDVSKVVELLKREYNRRADFSPLLWSKGMKLQLKEVYTSLRVVSGRKGGTLEIDVGDIFGSSEEDKDPLVLVEGSPGIGKTTFCLKLAHDWANGAMPSNFPIFKLVFLLKCRDMKGDIVEDVVEEIFEQLLPEDLKKKTKEAFVNFLEDVDNQKQILIIFDGLDELPKKSEDRVYKVLDRKKLSSCYVLATTRQEKGIYTWAEYKIGICLAIEGFSEENSFEYIRKHFRNIGTEHASKGERLIQEVKRNPLLGHLQTNPLNLLLLCVVYQDHEGSLPSSITDLYQIIVRCLFRRYCAKEELKASVKDEDVDKQFEIAILALGGLAWECLLNGHLSFYEDELEELERSNENVVARRLGLVYKEESVKKLKPRHTYSFLHKTFQEYLAASYIAYNLRGSQVFVLKQVRFSLASPKFRQVCLFVCGILREEASILFTQIGDALQEHWDWSKCIRETASFFNEILKESGNAERVANTFCSFLPFPWVLHVSKYDYKELINVLEACAGFSKVQTPAELHVTIPPGLEVHENIQRVLARVPNVKTLILPAVRYSIDRAEVGKVLRASKTLKNVTFALSAGHGEDWASALDVGLGADSSLSSVDLRIHGILNQSALRAVENLLFNKCLSSLSITMCGDAQESLAEVLARSLVGESAVEFLDLCVNGKLSLDGAYSLEDGILSNKSLRNVNLSVYGELPANWQAVEENLHAKLAEKGVLSAIYPSTFSRVKGIDVIRLHRFVKTYYVQQNVTLNVWGELSGVDSKAVFKVILHTPVSHLTLNIRGQLTDEILRCTARGVKEKEKLSSVTINTWVQMTEKESNLIKELGLDNNPSVSLNVCGTSVSFKESSDRKVLSSDESQCLVPFLEKESTSRGYVLGEAFAKRTSMNSLTQVINTYDNGRTLFAGWGYELGEGLARGISLNSLTLALNNYSGTGDFSLRKLGEYLAKITSLNSLTLAFSNYDGSSSLSMHDFGKDLAKITSLNSLTLAFNIYKDTSTFCMDDLGKNLAKLTFLNSLTLAFINYVGSSWFFVDDFGEGWAKSTSLSSHWHLTTTVTVTESGMTMFSKVWKRASL